MKTYKIPEDVVVALNAYITNVNKKNGSDKKFNGEVVIREANKRILNR